VWEGGGVNPDNQLTIQYKRDAEKWKRLNLREVHKPGKREGITQKEG